MNRSRKIIASLALLTVTTLSGGCGVDENTGHASETTRVTEPAPSPQVSPVPGPAYTGDGGSDTDDAGTASENGDAESSDEEIEQLQEDIEAAVRSTDEFWQAHWSEYFTGTYTAPEVYGIYDGDDPASAPLCDGAPLEADNAFYCNEGDYVAWDAGLMLRSLDVGNPWVYLVVAHEWGHAVQNRLDDSLVWQGEELQADCFAGAALYGAEQDGSISLEPGAEKQLVDALSSVADETHWNDSSDHGDPFERIEAFNTGRTEGVAGCLPS